MFKELISELVKKVPAELAAILLVCIIVIFILVYLIREQSKDHIAEINKISESYENISKEIGSFKDKVTGSMASLKTTVELLVPMVVGKNKQ